MARAPAHTPHEHHHNATRLQRWLSQSLLGLLYALALSALVVWEYRDRFESLGNECTLTDAPAHSALFNASYARVLNWAAADTAHHVTEIAIPLGLDEIQSNACLGRAYMADLLRALARLQPAEVVIDKFYSPTTCASMPQSTQEMIAAAAALPVPVVVGESTLSTLELTDSACLCRKPQLAWSAPNIHLGLTRLNSENEKLPLQWRVLPSPGARHAVAADSLALASVRLYDPEYTSRPRIQALLASERHPYADLEQELPRTSSTALLCIAGTPEMLARWSPDCTTVDRPLPNLTGHVVLIGAESKDDIRTVLDRPRWGFDLQAHYMEALLSGTFLRTVPFAASFVVFAMFVFFTEGVPTLLVRFRPRWKKRRLLCHAYKRRRYFWTLFWAAACIGGTGVVALALHYLPPLTMFGDIVLVAMTRLLVFAAESTEHPLLHPHRKDHHAMSNTTMKIVEKPGSEGGTSGVAPMTPRPQITQPRPQKVL